jgi:hypothetical protein
MKAEGCEKMGIKMSRGLGRRRRKPGIVISYFDAYELAEVA